jgi:hypothetical protein
MILSHTFNLWLTYVLCMHVKLKAGKEYMLDFCKIKLSMYLSEDSDDEGHGAVLRTKEVMVLL